MASSEIPTSKSSKPVSVLFVCLGNICRSTMAEGHFRSLTAFGTPSQHPLIGEIDSCGTGAYHAGDSPDSRTMAVLKEHGIKNYRHQARRVRVPEDFERFDYVLAMDENNLIDLRDMAKRAAKKGSLSGEETGKISLYGAFGGREKDEQVGDPYYGGRDGFDVAFEQISRFGEGLLKTIEARAGQ